MALRIKYKGNFTVKRVVKQIAILLVTLYVGGTIVNEIGDVVINTSSPLYGGLGLIGWTIETTTNATSSASCATDSGGGNTISNCITSTTGSGVLTVVGLIGVGAIVLSYLDFSF